MIIDGKKIASDIQAEIREAILLSKHRKPCLAVILVGDHPASKLYITKKTEACESVGIQSIKLSFSSTITQETLIHEIRQLNSDSFVDGILVQLPLPEHINPKKIMHEISPDKDVDGFHPYNVGKMLIGETDGFIPCTPLGIKKLLERSNIEVSGKHAVILGRSNIVGKPMAALLIQPAIGANATVTTAHSHTKNLTEICQTADILISAMGQPLFVNSEMVKEGAVVIDVGTNKIIDITRKTGHRIVGDVDFDNVVSKCSYITPVPGGVGPMTIAMLLQNTLLSYQRRFNSLS